MKSIITFVNPNTYERHYLGANFSILLLVGGIIGLVIAIFGLTGPLPSEFKYATPIIVCLSHALYYRYMIIGFPVIVSIIAALSSGGVTMILSSFMLNRYIAEAYRANGWKVSDHEGNIGEYSSKFLAQEEFNFNDSDVLNNNSTKNH